MSHRLLFCALATAVFIGPAYGAQKTISGKPEIISGDTLSIGGTTVRLAGIDAPETGQNCRVVSGRIFDCGRISATALMDLTVAATVSCRLTGERLDSLPSAKCTAGGYDLSKGMVHTGWALAWPRSGTNYSAVEAAARKRKHGLWRGRFEMPWDWRRKQRGETK
ncbi:MAG: thermonuclease family protein [Rhodospirillaceae bacterium]|jgi:endonuclease YncB( thermonuclease family)|nr:thermonuclease family protein [Rhodospirillaceae bacterium]MBT5457613.1 thermonuclease family protein [Rhodospirillaceae bacterium]